MIFNEDNETISKVEKDEEVIKFRKESSSRKKDSSLHQARKDFNKKKYMKGKECRNFHEDERKMVYQKTQEKWDFMKDHSSW